MWTGCDLASVDFMHMGVLVPLVFLFPSTRSAHVVGEAEGRKAIDLWGNADCVILPQTRCPDSCSLRGACVKVWGVCRVNSLNVNGVR